MKTNKLFGAIALVTSLVGGPALAGSITLDGIFNPSNDAYTHQFVLPLKLDDGTSAGTTFFKVGVGTNADGVTGGSNNLFVYAELPLELKDMTWGTGTHNGYSTSSKDVSSDGIIAMNQNTGSEGIKFSFGGSGKDFAADIKLSQRGWGGWPAPIRWSAV